MKCSKCGKNHFKNLCGIYSQKWKEVRQLNKLIWESEAKFWVKISHRRLRLINYIHTRKGV